MEDLFSKLESDVKNVAIKMGNYKFSIHSYIYDFIFRSRKGGVTLDILYKNLDQYDLLFKRGKDWFTSDYMFNHFGRDDAKRIVVFNCLLYMVKKGEVEAFHTQKNYFKMRYRIKGKWD